jgi:threonine/homoserine/homoserine lactone efflux protein
MSHAPSLLVGLLFGLALAAPIGPVNVICLRRALAAGFLAGISAGVGAALADGAYALAAALGASALSGAVSPHVPLLRTVCGIALVGFGLLLFRAEPVAGRAEARVAGHVGGFAAAFLLTLANPLPALSLGAVFGLAGGLASTPRAAAPFVAAVFVGSMSWWCALAGVATLARRRVEGDALRLVNRVSAVLLSLFGLAVLAAS